MARLTPLIWLEIGYLEDFYFEWNSYYRTYVPRVTRRHKFKHDDDVVMIVHIEMPGYETIGTSQLTGKEYSTTDTAEECVHEFVVPNCDPQWNMVWWIVAYEFEDTPKGPKPTRGVPASYFCYGKRTQYVYVNEIWNGWRSEPYEIEVAPPPSRTPTPPPMPEEFEIGEPYWTPSLLAINVNITCRNLRYEAEYHAYFYCHSNDVLLQDTILKDAGQHFPNISPDITLPPPYIIAQKCEAPLPIVTPVDIDIKITKKVGSEEVTMKEVTRTIPPMPRAIFHISKVELSIDGGSTWMELPREKIIIDTTELEGGVVTISADRIPKENVRFRVTVENTGEQAGTGTIDGVLYKEDFSIVDHIVNILSPPTISLDPGTSDSITFTPIVDILHKHYIQMWVKNKYTRETTDVLWYHFLKEVTTPTPPPTTTTPTPPITTPTPPPWTPPPETPTPPGVTPTPTPPPSEEILKCIFPRIYGGKIFPRIEEKSLFPRLACLLELYERRPPAPSSRAQ
ncbi:MAG: hypothetical protein ACXQTS_07760 [Candidatus Methanospirareceae archaeon]